MATATTVAGPSETKRRRDNDPLGARVVAIVDATTEPFWRTVTFHGTPAPDGSLEVRRLLPDLPGADTVSARAWGPRGLTCNATATLGEG